MYTPPSRASRIGSLLLASFACLLLTLGNRPVPATARHPGVRQVPDHRLHRGQPSPGRRSTSTPWSSRIRPVTWSAAAAGPCTCSARLTAAGRSCCREPPMPKGVRSAAARYPTAGAGWCSPTRRCRMGRSNSSTVTTAAPPKPPAADLRTHRPPDELQLLRPRFADPQPGGRHRNEAPAAGLLCQRGRLPGAMPGRDAQHVRRVGLGAGSCHGGELRPVSAAIPTEEWTIMTG